MSVSLIDRQKEFIKLILSHKAFKDVLRLHLDNGEMPNKEVIVEIMKRSNCTMILQLLFQRLPDNVPPIAGSFAGVSNST